MGKKSRKKIEERKKRAAILEEEALTGRGTHSNIDWFGINLLIAISICVLFIFSITMEEGTDSYYNMHSGLLTVTLLSILLFFVRRNVNTHIYRVIRKLFKTSEKLTLYEYGDILLGTTYLIAMISIFFIDYSFFSNYGIRIGTVVAINLFFLLKSLYLSFLKNK